MPNYNNYPMAYQPSFNGPSGYGPQTTGLQQAYGYNAPSYGWYQPQQPSYGVDQSMNSFIWVQGEAGANAHQVARGQTVMLMDANPNSNMFYIKSADPYTGRPLPLEKYHYSRVIENSQNDQQNSMGMDPQNTNNAYVPREEFDALKAQIAKLQKTLADLEE
jgi:hypothetical protein